MNFAKLLHMVSILVNGFIYTSNSQVLSKAVGIWEIAHCAGYTVC